MNLAAGTNVQYRMHFTVHATVCVTVLMFDYTLMYLARDTIGTQTGPNILIVKRNGDSTGDYLRRIIAILISCSQIAHH